MPLALTSLAQALIAAAKLARNQPGVDAENVKTNESFALQALARAEDLKGVAKVWEGVNEG